MTHENPLATREPWMDPLPTSMDELDDYTRSYWRSGYEGEANEIVTVRTVMLAMRSMFWFRV